MEHLRAGLAEFVDEVIASFYHAGTRCTVSFNRRPTATCSLMQRSWYRRLCRAQLYLLRLCVLFFLRPSFRLPTRVVWPIIFFYMPKNQFYFFNLRCETSQCELQFIVRHISFLIPPVLSYPPSSIFTNCLFSLSGYVALLPHVLLSSSCSSTFRPSACVLSFVISSTLCIGCMHVPCTTNRRTCFPSLHDRNSAQLHHYHVQVVLHHTELALHDRSTTPARVQAHTRQ